MNYWLNPIQSQSQTNTDLVAASRHNGKHRLYYHNAVPVSGIDYTPHLSDYCDMLNNYKSQLAQDFATTPSIAYHVANVVKINLWVHSLQTHGNVKPMLLHCIEPQRLSSATGATRLMAAELIPGFKTVAAFIDTTAAYHQYFQSFEQIHNFSQFAARCGTDTTTDFWFRLTDNQAAFGLDWYEASVMTPGVSVPQESWCVAAVDAYLKNQSSEFEFTMSWFKQTIDWDAEFHRSQNRLG